MSFIMRFFYLQACRRHNPQVHQHPLPWLTSFSSISTRRHLYSSRQNLGGSPRPLNSNRKLAGIIFSAIMVTGVGIAYNVAKSRPTKLESKTEWLQDSQLTERYVSPVTPISMEQASEILRWEETSQAVGMGSGVLRFDRVRLASNSPTEDEFVSATAHEGDEIVWGIWGVFDGHSGCATAVALESYMIKYIIRKLSALSPTDSPGDIAPNDVDQALRIAFLELDRDIIEEAVNSIKQPTSLTNAMSRLSPGYSGSCALVSYYHSASQQLKVACTGDSRAVLGRRNAAGKWEATALSKDQTGYNEDEIARLKAEHPNETKMIHQGRLLGMAVTRAFGDISWKWSNVLLEQAKRRFLGPPLRGEPYLTPPYMTAEPIITTTKVEPEKGDFLILATDGLWDNLTSGQAVDLVGRWLEKYDPAEEVKPRHLAAAPTIYTPQPATKKVLNLDTEYGYASRVDERDFVVIDENAATHLVRNSLGGGNEDMLCGKLTPIAPLSRKLRDDITVQVIFFGDDGTIIANY